ncbi:AlpA family transcriptional regulator [uncultured Shewanella sp.]|uniref:AlpA family transcriptional regulator n=1 Tax=uncultured Shewanella sp. TaxID=173975 RepID=UPI0026283EDD|nr:AlpA family transcriptional regulator [uncultured Shewanella sp.]
MKILRLKEVITVTGLARSTIYEHIALKQFPKPLPLGARAVGWLDSEISLWIEQRIAERDNT